MNHRVTLIISSLLAILFASFHLADDIVRGFEPGRLSSIVGVLILVVWLYGTVMLADRRLGCVIIFFASLGGSGVPVIHMTGAGLAGGRIVNSSGRSDPAGIRLPIFSTRARDEA